MADDSIRPESGFLRDRRLYWRSMSGLLLILAVAFACSAGTAYLIIDPELAKDYFSAHRTVKQTWQLLLPGLAASAAVGFLLAGAGAALSLRGHSRRQLEPLRQIDGLIRQLGQGRLPQPRPAQRAGAVDEVAAVLAPLRTRVEELQRISRDLQKVALELNYRSAGTADVTRKDLRALATQLDALTKDLSAAAGWFEG